MGFFFADPFLPLLALAVARRMPGIAGMPGIPPPLIICRIIFWPSRNRTTRFFPSPTVEPEPFAIRARREPFKILGLRRSAGVIELTMAAAWSRSASLAWSVFQVKLVSTNLLNSQYRLGEYDYASDFHSQAQPTLVPERTFTAGAPRGVFGTLAITWLWISA